jgi:hypothetical protein
VRKWALKSRLPAACPQDPGMVASLLGPANKSRDDVESRLSHNLIAVKRRKGDKESYMQESKTLKPIQFSTNHDQAIAEIYQLHDILITNLANPSEAAHQLVMASDGSTYLLPALMDETATPPPALELTFPVQGNNANPLSISELREKVRSEDGLTSLIYNSDLAEVLLSVEKSEQYKVGGGFLKIESLKYQEDNNLRPTVSKIQIPSDSGAVKKRPNLALKSVLQIAVKERKILEKVLRTIAEDLEFVTQKRVAIREALWKENLTMRLKWSQNALIALEQKEVQGQNEEELRGKIKLVHSQIAGKKQQIKQGSSLMRKLLQIERLEEYHKELERLEKKLASTEVAHRMALEEEKRILQEQILQTLEKDTIKKRRQLKGLSSHKINLSDELNNLIGDLERSPAWKRIEEIDAEIEQFDKKRPLEEKEITRIAKERYKEYEDRQKQRFLTVDKQQLTIFPKDFLPEFAVTELLPMTFSSSNDHQKTIEEIYALQKRLRNKVQLVSNDPPQVEEIENKLLVGSDGFTYLLEDILRFDGKQAELSPLSFPVRREGNQPYEGKTLSVLEVKQASAKQLASLIHNDPLEAVLKSLSSTSSSKLAITFPKCAITKEETFSPMILSDCKNTYDSDALASWFKSKEVKLCHPENPKQVLKQGEVIKNNSLAELLRVACKEIKIEKRILSKQLMQEKNLLKEKDVDYGKWKETAESYTQSYQEIKLYNQSLIKPEAVTLSPLRKMKKKIQKKEKALASLKSEMSETDAKIKQINKAYPHLKEMDNPGLRQKVSSLPNSLIPIVPLSSLGGVTGIALSTIPLLVLGILAAPLFIILLQPPVGFLLGGITGIAIYAYQYRRHKEGKVINKLIQLRKTKSEQGRDQEKIENKLTLLKDQLDHESMQKRIEKERRVLAIEEEGRIKDIEQEIIEKEKQLKMVVVEVKKTEEKMDELCPETLSKVRQKWTTQPSFTRKWPAAAGLIMGGALGAIALTLLFTAAATMFPLTLGMLVGGGVLAGAAVLYTVYENKRIEKEIRLINSYKKILKEQTPKKKEVDKIKVEINRLNREREGIELEIKDKVKKDLRAKKQNNPTIKSREHHSSIVSNFTTFKKTTEITKIETQNKENEQALSLSSFLKKT